MGVCLSALLLKKDRFCPLILQIFFTRILAEPKLALLKTVYRIFFTKPEGICFLQSQPSSQWSLLKTISWFERQVSADGKKVHLFWGACTFLFFNPLLMNNESCMFIKTCKQHASILKRRTVILIVSTFSYMIPVYQFSSIWSFSISLSYYSCYNFTVIFQSFYSFAVETAMQLISTEDANSNLLLPPFTISRTQQIPYPNEKWLHY